MKNLKEVSHTELLKLVNDTKQKHEETKKDLLYYTEEFDKLQVVINDKISLLTEIEKEYIILIEEINNR